MAGVLGAFVAAGRSGLRVHLPGASIGSWFLCDFGRHPVRDRNLEPWSLIFDLNVQARSLTAARMVFGENIALTVRKTPPGPRILKFAPQEICGSIGAF